MLLTYTKDEEYERKIISAIFKSVSQLHYMLQKLIKVRLLKRMRTKLENRKKSRQWRYFNNRLIKCLMADGQTQKNSSHKQLKGNYNMRAIKIKANKIEICLLE